MKPRYLFPPILLFLVLLIANAVDAQNEHTVRGDVRGPDARQGERRKTRLGDASQRRHHRSQGDPGPVSRAGRRSHTNAAGRE